MVVGGDGAGVEEEEVVVVVLVAECDISSRDFSVSRLFSIF